MRDRPLRFWIAVVFVVAVVSLVVDLNTGDTTGPPYHDSLFNHFAFFIFWGSTVVLFALCVFAVLRWVFRRLPKGA